jgi:DGQHR domain-containing protein
MSGCKLKIKSFSIKQKGGLEDIGIYVTTMTALDLIERCAIDRWTIDNTKGYQRVPEEGRFSEGRGSIVRYLMKEIGCFPTSVLLNVRGDMEFEENDDLGWCSLGDLDIGEERLWLIDGQHRIEALKRAVERNADFEQYPVVVSILQLPKRFDELMLFYIVNRRQRGVPTDLAYRHLQRMLWEKGTEWLYELEGRRGVQLGLATEVVDYLCEDKRSPWFQRIKRVAEPRREEHIVQDKKIIRSVADILKEKVFEGMQVSELADLLIDYWNAVARVYPVAFEDPRSYTLLGTPGLFVLHKLFPSIYARCAKSGVITEEGMRKILELLLLETPGHSEPDFRRPISMDFWSREHGPLIAISTNANIIKDLYRHLQTKIILAEKG